MPINIPLSWNEERQNASDADALNQELRKNYPRAPDELEALVRELADKDKREALIKAMQSVTPYYYGVEGYAGADALRKCPGVYIISRKDPDTVRVKIGMTENDFTERFKKIRSDCRHVGVADPEPVFLVPMAERILETEREIHAALERQGIKRNHEWFETSPEKAMEITFACILAKQKEIFRARKTIPAGSLPQFPAKSASPAAANAGARSLCAMLAEKNFQVPMEDKNMGVRRVDLRLRDMLLAMNRGGAVVEVGGMSQGYYEMHLELRRLGFRCHVPAGAAWFRKKLAKPSKGRIYVEAHSAGIREALEAEGFRDRYYRYLLSEGGKLVDGRMSSGHGRLVSYVDLPLRAFLSDSVSGHASANGANKEAV